MSTGSRDDAPRLGDMTPGAAGREVVELQHLLLLLGELGGGIDGVLSEATTRALRGLQRRFAMPDTGEITPALTARAHQELTRDRANAHARAAASAEAAADLYEQIAAKRRAEVEAARARVPPRPTTLPEEETGASLLAAARSRLDAAAQWLRAAALDDDPSARRLARARHAQTLAHRSALAADPWFRSAAEGHLAASDLLQGSRALDGAAKAAALAAAALLPDPP